MKTMTFLAALLFGTLAMADGHYAGIKVETRDGQEGATDSTAVGLTLGKAFTRTLSGEIYTRTKWDEGQDSNNTRIEGALAVSIPLADRWSWYTRNAVGEKFVSGNQYTYWSIEPGVKFRMTPAWSLRTGVRFRDSFGEQAEQTHTYRFAAEYRWTDTSTLSLGLDQQQGVSEHRALGLGFTQRF